MHEHSPAAAFHFLPSDSEELTKCLVDELLCTVLVVHPDDQRQPIGHAPEASFAFEERPLSHLASGDIDRHPADGVRMAARIADRNLDRQEGVSFMAFLELETRSCQQHLAVV